MKEPKNSNLVKEGDLEKRFRQMWYHSDTDLVAPRPETVKAFIQSEKQLSYQEGVEKARKNMNNFIDEAIAGWHRTASMNIAYYDALQYLRHQLSNLKEEKQL